MCFLRRGKPDDHSGEVQLVESAPNPCDKKELEKEYAAHVLAQSETVSKCAGKLSSNIGKPGYIDLSVVATLTVFVQPFINSLGWNTSNPNEVQIAAAPGAASTNVTLFRNGAPSVIIEVVNLGASPDQKKLPLSEKYAATAADIGILTNGIDYHFYAASDDDTHTMCAVPFATLSITDLSMNKRDGFLTYLFRYAFTPSRLIAFSDAKKANETIYRLMTGCSDDAIERIRDSIFCEKFGRLVHPSVPELLRFVGVFEESYRNEREGA